MKLSIDELTRNVLAPRILPKIISVSTLSPIIFIRGWGWVGVGARDVWRWTMPSRPHPVACLLVAYPQPKNIICDSVERFSIPRGLRRCPAVQIICA